MIPTAKEFLKEEGCHECPDSDLWSFVDKFDLIEFAKLHVQEALKQASKEAYMFADTRVSQDEIYKDIKDSYPLSNIK